MLTIANIAAVSDLKSSWYMSVTKYGHAVNIINTS